MVSAFLVNLNELEKKASVEHEGKVKGLITDPMMTINQKGVNQFKIKSYHRFIAFTNKDDPIKTSGDDRRNFIIRSSDELIPKTEYQNNLKELSRTPIDLWLENFTLRHLNVEKVEKMGAEIFQDFNEWKTKNGIEYITSTLKMGVYLTNMKIEGIEKGRHTMKEATSYFNITLLRTRCFQ
jgi:phage/plasmid-associated DNA primase